MAAIRDDSGAHQSIKTQRDAYVAGRDINFHEASPGTRLIERRLAEAVLKQAQDTRSLLIGTDVGGDETADVGYARIPGRLREPKGREVGSLRSILEFYQSLSPQRLVVIGAPGAGKTVLLLELQIRLLEEHRKDPETQVPVLISASSCDTSKKWDEWFAGHLAVRFSIPERTAADLIRGGRVLPIVDGLDEMDPAGDDSPERAQALVRSLNASMRGLDRAPVVVTCRPGEYSRLAQELDRARHVELSGLTSREAADYLEGQFRSESERDRWKPVMEALRRDPDGPLAAGLSTPWRLTLALAAFRSGGDPGDLLPPESIDDDSHAAHVDAALLNGYIPAAVSLYQENVRYSEPKVRGWLAGIADGLEWQARHGRSATDITLHEWWRPQQTWTAELPYTGIMLLPYLASVIIASWTRDIAIWLAAYPAIVGLGASATFFLVANNPRTATAPNRIAARGRAAIAAAVTVSLGVGLPLFLTDWLMWGFAAGLRYGIEIGVGFALAASLAAALAERVANGLVHGLMVGLVIAIVVGLPKGIDHGVGQGLAFGLTYGLAAGLMDGLAVGFTNRSPKVRRPWAIIRTNGWAGLAGGIAGGICVGFTGGLTAEFLTAGEAWHDLYAISSGLVVGLTIWLAVCARIWIRYHLGVAWSFCRGKGPLRFGKFLNWAVEAGLLRESGISYQFRHRQLQDWLVSTQLNHQPGPAEGN